MNYFSVLLFAQALVSSIPTLPAAEELVRPASQVSGSAWDPREEGRHGSKKAERTEGHG